MTPAEVVAVLEGDGGAALGEFLRRQRWFAAKARGLDAVRIEDWAVLDQRGLAAHRVAVREQAGVLDGVFALAAADVEDRQRLIGPEDLAQLGLDG